MSMTKPVAVIGSGGSVYYVLSYHLNTPRQIINADNELRWRWDNIDPFGVNLPDTNPQGLGGFAYALRFPGQYYDSESGLFYKYYRSLTRKADGIRRVIRLGWLVG